MINGKKKKKKKNIVKNNYKTFTLNSIILKIYRLSFNFLDFRLSIH